MPRPIDLTGRQVGSLTVDSVCESDHLGRRQWLCHCQCGATVKAVTHDLIATNKPARVSACPACGGPTPKAPWPCVCTVCNKPFLGHGSHSCSLDCQTARRRGREAGVPYLPPPVIYCEICGARVRVKRGVPKTCSPECLRERRRRRALAAWYKRIQVDPDLSKKMHRRRRERAASDPVYAAKLREWDHAKDAKHRIRMQSDPEYAAKIRERHNAQYFANREAIQLRRRQRLDALPPAELEAWLSRARHYCREHRRRFYADLRANPEQHQKYVDTMREYRRQLTRQKFARQALQAAILLGEKLSELDHQSATPPPPEPDR